MYLGPSTNQKRQDMVFESGGIWGLILLSPKKPLHTAHAIGSSRDMGHAVHDRHCTTACPFEGSRGLVSRLCFAARQHSMCVAICLRRVCPLVCFGSGSTCEQQPLLLMVVIGRCLAHANECLRAVRANPSVRH
jgi:hypothetical protein